MVIDQIFSVATAILAFSIGSSLFLRLKYRRFGKISWVWEKIGWFLMFTIILFALSVGILAFQNRLDNQKLKILLIILALYFLWYAITMWKVTTSKKVKR